MDLIKHIASRNETAATATKVVEALQTLTKSIVELRKPKPGPYLLFHHAGSVVERSRQLSLLLARLHNNRVELLKNDIIEDVTRPKDWPGGVPYPKEYQEIILKSQELDNEIVLDFQTMIIFGGMLLDEWAHLAAYVFSAPKPDKFTFDILVKSDGDPPFHTLWKVARDDILWLDAIPRLFRNKFIVHKELPWQSGHTRSMYLLDWSFWVPIAAGWLTDKETRNYKIQIADILKKKKISGYSDNLHEFVFAALDNIAQFDRDDRVKISKIAMNVGFGTPSFQRFGKRMFEFILLGTNHLIESAKQNPATLNLGGRQN